MPEGLSTTEVIGEHRAHPAEGHVTRDRAISIIEALMLSIVALMAAWSGYSAAKWGTEASLSLAKAAGTRSRSSLLQVQATQTRTLDSVSFNAVEGAYVAHDTKLFDLAVKRLRPGYRPAFNAWLATHPLKNPAAPADPSLMPQYVIPQEAQARTFAAQSTAFFTTGEAAANTADKYVRLTVVLAAVLFLVGIGSRFPVRAGRYGLIAVAGGLLVFSVVQLLGLPGPPSR